MFNIKPIFVAEKTDYTTIEFYDLEFHPKALRFVYKKNNKIIREHAVPRATIERLRDEKKNIIDFYLSPPNISELKRSLPPNPLFWAVPKESLDEPESEKNDLYKFYSNFTGLDDPNCLLIHRSSWDGQIWDIEFNAILIPLTFELWGTRFDLNEVAEFLKGKPGIISFDIVPNRCRQNYEISGRYLGNLILDPKKLDIPLKTPLTRSFFEDNVFHGFNGPKFDYLGLHQFFKG